jgi:hypothetical protein
MPPWPREKETRHAGEPAALAASSQEVNTRRLTQRAPRTSTLRHARCADRRQRHCTQPGSWSGSAAARSGVRSLAERALRLAPKGSEVRAEILTSLGHPLRHPYARPGAGTSPVDTAKGSSTQSWPVAQAVRGSARLRIRSVPAHSGLVPTRTLNVRPRCGAGRSRLSVGRTATSRLSRPRRSRLR